MYSDRRCHPKSATYIYFSREVRHLEDTEETIGALESPPKRGRKNGVQGRATTLYLSVRWGAYQQICRAQLGKSGSARLSELMEQDLVRLQGGDSDGSANVILKISELKQQVAKLIAEGARLQRILKDAKSYSALENLVDRWRLDFNDFSNLDDVVAKLLQYSPAESDQFSKDAVELFVQLLEVCREKCVLKKHLDELRLRRINGKQPQRLQQPADSESPEQDSDAPAESPQAEA